MRRNNGNHEGKYIGSVQDNAWRVYETATGYRIASLAPTTGKANYSLRITDGKIDRGAGGDYSALQEQRPELYTAVEEFFGAENAPRKVDPNDPYGDIARSQNKTLTPEQHWRRALLYMRTYEFENTSKNVQGDCDAGIRITYASIFKFKISDEDYAAAREYITNHSAQIDLSVLLSVLRDYFDGKYRPHSCATLSQQFDLIGGTLNDDLSR